jgi:hypothetical protein
MNEFRQWYLTHSTQITWFLIGLLTMSGFEALLLGNYGSAALSFGIAYLNYMLDRK